MGVGVHPQPVAPGSGPASSPWQALLHTCLCPVLCHRALQWLPHNSLNPGDVDRHAESCDFPQARRAGGLLSFCAPAVPTRAEPGQPARPGARPD